MSEPKVNIGKVYNCDCYPFKAGQSKHDKNCASMKNVVNPEWLKWRRRNPL